MKQNNYTMSNWESCKNILCILPDNMGELMMTGPAMRVLKESFDAKITVLTSPMAAEIANDMPEVDDVIIFTLPWINVHEVTETSDINFLVDDLKQRNFDGAVIFTRYNRNSLPAAMLAYMAGIPRRLAYCREDPYQLLTNWLLDKGSEQSSNKEAHVFVKNQVKRDLDLVAAVGAISGSERFSLTKKDELWPNVRKKLTAIGVDVNKKWMVLHPGVNDVKREYPVDKWSETAKKLIDEFDCQVIFTGSYEECRLTDYLQHETGEGSFSMAGSLDLRELVVLIDKSPLVISVNTAIIHIAASLSTPTIVLYALAPPQVVPWRSPCKVLHFEMSQVLEIRNEYLRFIIDTPVNTQNIPSADDVVKAAYGLLKHTSPDFVEIKLKHTA